MLKIVKTIFGMDAKAREDAGGNGDAAGGSLRKLREAAALGGQSGLLRRALLIAAVIVIVWEVIGRPLVALLWPEITLPPSCLREVIGILAGVGI